MSAPKSSDKSRLNSGKVVDVNEGNNVLTNTLCHVRSQDPQTLQELIGFEAHLEARRTEHLNALAETVSQIQTKLHTLKVEVRGDFTMELRDADYYRVSMFQLEGKISQLKEAIKDELCSLMKEEHELNKELQLMDRRVEEWGKPLNARIFKPIVNSLYRVQSQEEDDPAGEFQKFVSSSGGHCGGWEEQDHLLFLRERRKCNGKPKFIQVVHCLLPDISQDEILAHEAWYQKYESLKDLQREAIRKWRASKVAVNDHLSEPAENEKETAERNHRPKNHPGYQRDIAERIKEWKRQQMIKKAEEEERQREEQQRQHEERLRKREIHKSKKAVVEQYKAEKLSRLQAELLSQQMKELQALEDRARKSVLLKAFRDQDQQYVDRKKFLRIQSAMKEKERMEKIEHAKPSIEITVDRDPQRVLKPTQVWSQHCLQQDDLARANRVLNLQSIPHLAVPAWRKGLSNI